MTWISSWLLLLEVRHSQEQLHNSLHNFHRFAHLQRVVQLRCDKADQHLGRRTNLEKVTFLKLSSAQTPVLTIWGSMTIKRQFLLQGFWWWYQVDWLEWRRKCWRYVIALDPGRHPCTLQESIQSKNCDCARQKADQSDRIHKQQHWLQQSCSGAQDPCLSIWQVSVHRSSKREDQSPNKVDDWVGGRRNSASKCFSCQDIFHGQNQLSSSLSRWNGNGGSSIEVGL